MIAGWPTDALVLYVVLFTALTIVMLGGLMIVTWRNAERLATKTAHASADRHPVVPLQPFDSLAHLALPMAIACGAVADIGLRGTGAPSLLACAVAASRLRIAWRDWPTRAHYLLGALAASISALHFALVPFDRTLDWVVWFLLLMSAASCVEGVLDTRLSRERLNAAGEDHAHTV